MKASPSLGDTPVSSGPPKCEHFPRALNSAMPTPGQRFGRLTAIKRIAGKWRCRCDCGKVVRVFRENLTSGHTRSCGCLARDVTARRNRDNARHGHCKNNQSTKIYRVWSSMLERCRSPQHHAYDRYGGRGITVCDRWLVFENFLADMGECPSGYSLDRINNDGNYEPSNCRWATDSEQNKNRRPRRAA